MISSGGQAPHARPMGVCRTCGDPDEIELTPIGGGIERLTRRTVPLMHICLPTVHVWWLSLSASLQPHPVQSLRVGGALVLLCVRVCSCVVRGMCVCVVGGGAVVAPALSMHFGVPCVLQTWLQKRAIFFGWVDMFS